jgi:hypothetical protein
MYLRWPLGLAWVCEAFEVARGISGALGGERCQ